MRRFRSTCLIAAWLACASGFVFAQQRGGMMFGRDAMLLSNKGVMDELKLDSAQTEKMTALAARTREKLQGEMAKIRDLPQGERGEKARQAVGAIHEDVKKSLSEFLKPEQLNRYEQISLQARGPEAFADPQVQEKLKLSDEQKAKLKELNASMRAKMAEIRQAPQEERMRKMLDLRKESMSQAAGVLTEAQKLIWKEMTGEPFELRFGPPRNT